MTWLIRQAGDLKVQSDSTFKKPKAYLRDRLYIDEAYVTDEMLQAYECLLKIGQDPLSGEIFYETIHHYERIAIERDRNLIAFNRGNLDQTLQYFSNFEIIDERITSPMKNNLKIKFPEGRSWRTYQPDAVMAMTERDWGQLQAPPRSGKTLMLAGAVCVNREKTLILAHQTDLLLQCYDTFETYTNVKELRTAWNPVIGFPTNWEDFDTLDVVLCTKQTFDAIVNKPKLRMAQLLFGAIYIDEAHFTGAEVYAKNVNRFWAKTKQGVTATPERKDGKHVITNGILGGVFHKITPEEVGQLKLQVSVIKTGFKIRKDTSYITMINKCVKDEKRNELILSWMKRDVADGHTIVAVSDRVQHCKDLRDALMAQGISSEVFTGELTNKDRRRDTLNRSRSGETKVLIAMRQMTTGLDIPRANCFYNLLPSANAVKEEGEYEGGGGYEQQCTRVLTPFEGKRFGLARDFLDEGDAPWGCFALRQKTYTKMGAHLTWVFNENEKKAIEVDRGSSVDSVTF
jgi:superfamily II DNA or RNA helicase